MQPNWIQKTLSLFQRQDEYAIGKWKKKMIIILIAIII